VASPSRLISAQGAEKAAAFAASILRGARFGGAAHVGHGFQRFFPRIIAGWGGGGIVGRGASLRLSASAPFWPSDVALAGERGVRSFLEIDGAA